MIVLYEKNILMNIRGLPATYKSPQPEREIFSSVRNELFQQQVVWKV